jgi:hypothetical protein
MTRGQKNNNPVNLRYAGQKEATGKDDKGFAVFPDGPAGWRAAHGQIKLDADRGLSIKQFINKFAPPSENDTGFYIRFICDQLKIEPDTAVLSVSYLSLAAVMAQVEGYYLKEPFNND